MRRITFGEAPMGAVLVVKSHNDRHAPLVIGTKTMGSISQALAGENVLSWFKDGEPPRDSMQYGRLPGYSSYTSIAFSPETPVVVIADSIREAAEMLS